MRDKSTATFPVHGHSNRPLPRNMRWFDILLKLLCIAVFMAGASTSSCLEYSGVVTFNGLPLPGARVIATQSSTWYIAITDSVGVFRFADLSQGAWMIEVRMPCFATLKKQVAISTSTQSGTFAMTMESADQIQAEDNPQLNAIMLAPAAGQPASTSPATVLEDQPLSTDIPAAEDQQRTADGFLINGSMRNASTSQFSQDERFGNDLANKGRLYAGGMSISDNNSALNAVPYSLTGIPTAKPQQNQVTGALSLGGPLDIPHLMSHGPNFYVGYQWSRNTTAIVESALVPTLAERQGSFPQLQRPPNTPGTIDTGLEASSNVLAAVNPQAQALLNYYPLPNVQSNSGFNYQTTETTNLTQNALQSRFDRSLGERNQIHGGFAFQATRQSAPNLFQFVDTHHALGFDTQMNWWHRFGIGMYAPRNVFMTLSYHFSFLRNQSRTYFQNVENVSGVAGITGNNQDPENWGPPTLVFSSGIAGLSDGNSANNRNQSNDVTGQLDWIHRTHSVTIGEDFHRQQFNYFEQGNPRGTFFFTGVASGVSDFADFLTGVPDASALVSGNPDKYFRQNVYASYISDDWRARPDLTVTAGFRWEYGAPITELKNRLVNLDIAPGFTQVAPVLASLPLGSLTGQRYPASLVRPDRMGFEPRLGIAWRPLSTSSLVVRASYGIYDDTSVYQAMALAMAEQAPLAESISVANSATCPLTLKNGFINCPTSTPQRFAIDPNFRVGYAQVWLFSLQHDLPLALQAVATYMGIKGTRGPREVLPNTYAAGGTNPCPSCPLGFVFLDSNGNSTRQSGALQLRRRLMNGLTASMQYTFSKSIDDDAALGGQGPISQGAIQQISQALQIAQNWRNPAAERGCSPISISGRC